MRVKARRAVAILVGIVAMIGVLGATPAAATSGVSPFPVGDPAPGPGGCSVDIINREPGFYSASRQSVQFTYDLTGPSCRSGSYGLVVLNRFDRKQFAVYAQRGSGSGNMVAFDSRLPFVPTGSSTVLGGKIPGSGLCVIGFTVLAGRLTDVAPDQIGSLGDAIRSPQCSPLFHSGVPTGPARAFH